MVKGKIRGQPEIIFRKITFSVTAKRMHFPENHFRNHFEVDSNAALIHQVTRRPGHDKTNSTSLELNRREEMIFLCVLEWRR